MCPTQDSTEKDLANRNVMSATYQNIRVLTAEEIETSVLQNSRWSRVAQPVRWHKCKSKLEKRDLGTCPSCVC